MGVVCALPAFEAEEEATRDDTASPTGANETPRDPALDIGETPPSSRATATGTTSPGEGKSRRRITPTLVQPAATPPTSPSAAKPRRITPTLLSTRPANPAASAAAPVKQQQRRITPTLVTPNVSDPVPVKAADDAKRKREALSACPRRLRCQSCRGAAVASGPPRSRLGGAPQLTLLVAVPVTASPQQAPGAAKSRRITPTLIAPLSTQPELAVAPSAPTSPRHA